MRATLLLQLIAITSLLGCSDESEQHGKPDASDCNASANCEPAPTCNSNTNCLWPEACVRGVCSKSPTCDGVTTDGPVLCLTHEEISRLNGAMSPYPRLQLLVDGGAAALQSGSGFRCPRVVELRLNVGGESSGTQPICGPNAALSPLADAGDDVSCCYGTDVIAGP